MTIAIVRWITVTSADEYFAASVRADAWSALTEGIKEQALSSATNRLEALPLKFLRDASTEQYFTAESGTNPAPRPLRVAVAELGLYYAENPVIAYDREESTADGIVGIDPHLQDLPRHIQALVANFIVTHDNFPGERATASPLHYDIDPAPVPVTNGAAPVVVSPGDVNVDLSNYVTVETVDLLIARIEAIENAEVGPGGEVDLSAYPTNSQVNTLIDELRQVDLSHGRRLDALEAQIVAGDTTQIYSFNILNDTSEAARAGLFPASDITNRFTGFMNFTPNAEGTMASPISEATAITATAISGQYTFENIEDIASDGSILLHSGVPIDIKSSGGMNITVNDPPDGVVLARIARVVLLNGVEISRELTGSFRIRAGDVYVPFDELSYSFIPPQDIPYNGSRVQYILDLTNQLNVHIPSKTFSYWVVPETKEVVTQLNPRVSGGGGSVNLAAYATLTDLDGYVEDEELDPITDRLTALEAIPPPGEGGGGNAEFITTLPANTNINSFRTPGFFKFAALPTTGTLPDPGGFGAQVLRVLPYSSSDSDQVLQTLFGVGGSPVDQYQVYQRRWFGGISQRWDDWELVGDHDHDFDISNHAHGLAFQPLVQGDLNSVTTAGFYSYSQNANHPPGYPSGGIRILNIYDPSAESLFHRQDVWSSDGIYITRREIQDPDNPALTIWTEWAELEVGSDLSAYATRAALEDYVTEDELAAAIIDIPGPTNQHAIVQSALPQHTDLNDITAAGDYTFRGSSINAPFPGTGALRIYKSSGTNNNLRQDAYRAINTAPHSYFRLRIAGQFTDWLPVDTNTQADLTAINARVATLEDIDHDALGGGGGGGSGIATEEIFNDDVDIFSSNNWREIDFTVSEANRTGWWMINFGGSDTSGNRVSGAWYWVNVEQLFARPAGVHNTARLTSQFLTFGSAVHNGEEEGYIGHDSSGKILISTSSSQRELYPLRIHKVKAATGGLRVTELRPISSAAGLVARGNLDVGGSPPGDLTGATVESGWLVLSAGVYSFEVSCQFESILHNTVMGFSIARRRGTQTTEFGLNTSTYTDAQDNDDLEHPVTLPVTLHNFTVEDGDRFKIAVFVDPDLDPQHNPMRDVTCRWRITRLEIA